MKSFIFLLIPVAVILFGFESCKSGSESKPEEQKTPVAAIDAAHNSRNSLDWSGTYSGTIPCANCEGIRVQLTINTDLTYCLTYLYLGKGSEVPETDSGTFSWSGDGSMIELQSEHYPPYYQVGENFLLQLDLDRKPISGNLAQMYVLNKNI